MPDINGLFLELAEKKSPVYIAMMLDHGSSSRVDRWIKDGKVPDLYKWKVLELLRSEGYAK